MNQPRISPTLVARLPARGSARRSKRRYLQIADQLAESIRTDDLRRGDRLPSERELASRFDVSRQTVREALVALEVAGIVEIRLGSGVYVHSTAGADEQPDYEDAPGPLEIIEARRIFEAEAAALAAERIGNEELQQLKGRLRLMNRAAESGDTRQAEEHDRRFHLAIAEASRNSAIVSTIDYLWRLRSQSEISRSFHERARARGSKPSVDEHDRILKALVQRSPEAAREAMRTHISRVYDEFSQFSLS